MSSSSDPVKTTLPPTNGKAPARDPSMIQDRIVQVQPARIEDLQPSYAQKIQHAEDNPEAHGWYASLSEYPWSGQSS